MARHATCPDTGGEFRFCSSLGFWGSGVSLGVQSFKSASFGAVREGMHVVFIRCSKDSNLTGSTSGASLHPGGETTNALTIALV